jgi:alanine racemase
VPSTAHLRAVVAAANRLAVAANVHLKVDTGLSRNGATLAEWPGLVAMAGRYEKSGVVHVRGMWSHLAGADLPGDPSVSRQISQFQAAGRIAGAAGVHPALRHIANSAALRHAPESRLDLVRIGIALYGVEPAPGYPWGLRPALTVTAAVLLVKRVSDRYATDRATTLALLPVGFADGLPRRAAGRAEVLIHGVRCRVAGTIAMDQIAVDVGDLPVSAGDQAVLLGPGDRGEPTVNDWATWADTNPHEILTGVGARVPRRYRSGGETRRAVDGEAGAGRAAEHLGHRSDSCRVGSRPAP